MTILTILVRVAKSSVIAVLIFAPVLAPVASHAQEYPVTVDPAPIVSFVSEVIFSSMPDSSIVWTSGQSRLQFGRISVLKELPGISCQGTIYLPPPVPPASSPASPPGSSASSGSSGEPSNKQPPGPAGENFYLCTFDRVTVTSIGRVAIEGAGASLLANALRQARINHDAETASPGAPEKVAGIRNLGRVDIEIEGETGVSVALGEAKMTYEGREIELPFSKKRMISCREIDTLTGKGEFRNAPIFKASRMVCEIVLE